MTLQALVNNELASETDLIIYCDAARNQHDVVNVDAVKALIHNVSGFKSVRVIERETNYGLACNIIEGVTEVCRQYGRAIVLEDDVVANPQFLKFMNQALHRYASESRVWHISGWNYPIDSTSLGDAFFWRVMNCWGWATWCDRWDYFRKQPAQLVGEWDRKSIRTFNLDGAHNFWAQVLGNANGKLNTWAVFWYATIFENSGLCLNPSISLVDNIGHDGSGENCNKSTDYEILMQLKHKSEFIFPESIQESFLAVERIKKFYRGINQSWINRFISAISLNRR
jgi:hypothetical protein